MSTAESEKKIERLVDVARMYYEQDRTQSEIAVRYGISLSLIHIYISPKLRRIYNERNQYRKSTRRNWTIFSGI